MAKIFLSFADKRMRKSLARIKEQAKEMEIYDKIITSTEDDLDTSFRENFKEKLKYSVRGFGYWCWKPQIILQTLNKMEDGDILQYTDAGCHLNKSGINRLKYYFDICSKSQTGILAFQANPPTYPLNYDGRKLLDLSEHKWSKADTFIHFEVESNRDITHTPSIGSGILFIKKNKKTISIIEKWLEIYYTHFEIVDDTPSKASNHSDFIEHRHDQTVLSIICKLEKVDTLSAYEYWYPKINSIQPDWDALANFPIHAKRDRGLGINHKLLLKFSKAIKLLAGKK